MSIEVRTSETWEVVFRGDKPYAAFKLPGQAREFIAESPHRTGDTVARREITFAGLAGNPRSSVSSVVKKPSP